MPICRICGSSVPEGSIFCGSCGSPVEPSASSPSLSTIGNGGEGSTPGETLYSQPSIMGYQNDGQTYHNPQDASAMQPQNAGPETQPDRASGNGCLASAFRKLLSAMLIFIVLGLVGYCSFYRDSVSVRGGDTVASSTSTNASSDSAHAAASESSTSASATTASSTAQSKNTVACEYAGVRYEIPSSWVEGKDKDGGYYYRTQYSSGTNFKIVDYDMSEHFGFSSTDEIDIGVFARLYQQSLEDSGATDVDAQVLDISGHPAMRFSFEWYHERESDDKSEEYRYEIDELVFLESSVVELSGVCKADERSQWEDLFITVLSSVSVVS